MFLYLYRIFLNILQLFHTNNFSQITYNKNIEDLIDITNAKESKDNKDGCIFSANEQIYEDLIIQKDEVVPISYDSNEEYYLEQCILNWLY